MSSIFGEVGADAVWRDMISVLFRSLNVTCPLASGTHLGVHHNLTCDTTLSPIASTSTVGNHTLSHLLDLWDLA
jgi:hypothetical protein